MSEAQDKRSVPSKDFVLLIRDSHINVPSGFYSLNEHKEQAFMVNILTDVTPAALRQNSTVDAALSQNSTGDVDSDQNFNYQKNLDEESSMTEEEEKR